MTRLPHDTKEHYMTDHHKMTVEVDVQLDDYDIVERAAELALTEVQKKATWYGDIRDQLETIKVDEARDMIRERIALVLDRGFNHIGETGYWLGFPERNPDAPPCGLNYQTGAGIDPYKLDSFEDWFRAVLVTEAQKIAHDYAQKIAADAIAKAHDD
jgi:hypothetical protein